MSLEKVTIACPHCYSEGIVQLGVLGDKVLCPQCNQHFVATVPKEKVIRKCIQCGSNKIIPNWPMLDCFGDLGNRTQPAKVEVQGAPHAWIFKDATAGELTLSICGECGNAELRVTNAHLLWAKYQKSQQQ
jgi:hypothetical protein